MRRRWLPHVVPVVMLAWLVGPAPTPGFDEPGEPITYTARFPAPDQHVAEVEAVYPTGGRADVELMMPVWTPGFYRVENYAAKVQGLSARTPGGRALGVERTRANRWTVRAGGAA